MTSMDCLLYMNKTSGMKQLNVVPLLLVARIRDPHMLKQMANR